MAPLVKSRGLPLAAILAASLALRIPLLSHESGDYRLFISGWYDTLAAGGFHAFSRPFSNYAPLYLYLLYVATKLTFLPKLVAIKSINIFFDALSAWFAHEIVRRRYGRGWAPAGVFAAVLLSPMVVLIGSQWGQCDSGFTAMLLGFLLASSRQRWTSAAVFFGLALSFKLQSLFLAPVVLALAMARLFDWKKIAIIPAVYLASNGPAWIAGRSLPGLLKVYVDQAASYPRLSIHAPNIYQWLPGLPYSWGAPIGILLGGAATIALAVAAKRRLQLLRSTDLVLLALASSVLLPFLLPKMHERYFYAANAISIVFAFLAPGEFWIAIALQIASVFSCYRFLEERPAFPLPALAILTAVSAVEALRLIRRGRA